MEVNGVAVARFIAQAVATYFIMLIRLLMFSEVLLLTLPFAGVQELLRYCRA
jgi:hypothetical protein